MLNFYSYIAYIQTHVIYYTAYIKLMMANAQG